MQEAMTDAIRQMVEVRMLYKVPCRGESMTGDLKQQFSAMRDSLSSELNIVQPVYHALAS